MDKDQVHTYDIGSIGRMDATEIAERIRKKELSKEEVVHDVIERAKVADASINCLVTKDLNKQVWSTRADREVFSGVPTFIKDLTHVKGFPTTFGTRAVNAKPKNKNDKAVDQILSTGCVVLGKSTTSEFGLLPCTENMRNGNTLNPIDTKYSTGGSSGGAGALVAAGVVPFAHAEDGGGSIRIPASCCGFVGLKPTRDRHVAAPTKYLPLHIGCHGIVSRSVRDTANYYHSIEDHYKNSSLPAIGHVTGPAKRRLRIGMFTETPTGIDSHPDVVQSVIDAGKLCEGLGHKVEYIKSPFEQQFKLDFTIYWAFLSLMIRTTGKLSYDPSFNPDLIEPFTKGFGSSFPALALVGPLAIRRLRKFNQTYERVFDKFDVLLNPVASSVVPKIGHFSPEENFMITLERLNNYINFTIVQNATGAPAISLPMGKDSNGLPIGIQFATKRGEEKELLELAFEIEEADGFMSYF